MHILVCRDADGNYKHFGDIAWYLWTLHCRRYNLQKCKRCTGFRSYVIFGRPLQVTVRPMLRDCCLSVLSVLSVTLMYCGQTVGWIRMPHGTEVGLGLGDVVLDRDLSVNLECRPEMCCTRLAGNDAKSRHLRTIAQGCRAISSQLRHTSTIGKKPCQTAMSL